MARTISQTNAITAAFWMIGAMLSFSAMAVAGRELHTSLDTFEIMMYRSLLGIVLVLAIGHLAGTLHQISTNKLKIHFVRNVFHFSGQNLWFYAVAFIPFSQLFAFEFSTPLWVAAFAPFFLGERLTYTRILAAGIGFIGILIVARPDFTSISPAIIAAALCAVGFAGAVIATKFLTRTETITSILFWLTAMQAVFGIICAGYDGNIAFPEGVDILWVILVSICGLTAHFCITKALSLAPATIVSPLEFLRLPLITVIGYMLYNEALEWPVFLGAIIVFGANVINIYSEQNQKPAQT